MLFNSFNFAVFLPLVFALYWFCTKKQTRAQNILLLVASYFFYASWDWRFLFLLIFSTLLDYFTGIRIASGTNSSSRKTWLWISIVINLGFLAVFKYYNFFVSSFAEALSGLGLQTNPVLLQVILPVGISFYTFHGLSYILDIYKNKIQPEKNLIDYSLFVSFFPLLVAGPIERATHLLPQIRQPRQFNYVTAVDGLRQILWGLFKKVVIADQCALYVNQVFDPAIHYGSSTLLLGAVLFSIQIYCDFSGYSDIAIGTARLFGIELLRNFSFPYFSRSIAEFWRRWHISLSSWFRDYLYIPLGGSNGNSWHKSRNILIIFLVSAFWHGANWTFIAWGLLHAVYILPSVILKTNRNYKEIVAPHRILPGLREMLFMIRTFALCSLAWIFFRAESLAHAMAYIRGMFSNDLFGPIQISPGPVLVPIIILFTTEWINRDQQHGLGTLAIPTVARWALYYLMIGAVFNYSGVNQQFIYFQF